MAEPHAERPHMPDYGVNALTWVPLPWTWAAERLLGNRNFWVVTASGSGRPHALPVWGVWDESERRFAFSCGPNSRKARNLSDNSSAVVMVDDTVECVSVEGTATRVVDDRRQREWAERYVAKYQPMSAALSVEFVRQHLIIEFIPERAFGVIEREEEFATRPTRWVFST